MALEDNIKSLSKGKGLWNDTLKGDTISVRIVFVGDRQTSFRMLQRGEAPRNGKGWDFLKPFTDGQTMPFKGCPVKLAVKLNVYNKAGKRGITIHAEQMVINTREVAGGAAAEFDDVA